MLVSGLLPSGISTARKYAFSLFLTVFSIISGFSAVFSRGHMLHYSSALKLSPGGHL